MNIVIRVFIPILLTVVKNPIEPRKSMLLLFSNLFSYLTQGRETSNRTTLIDTSF